jgi:S-adenosylmethionine uptake transporter
MSIQTSLGRKDNLILAGVLIMLAGDFLFALNDAMGKWLVTSLPVGEVLLVRSIGAFIILGPMIARQGVSTLVRVESPRLQVLRVVFSTLDVGLFYAAVAYLPLADVMTFYMAGPIYVAAASHVFLGEKIGWRRWLAIFIGFIGVVIALKPSTAMFSLPSIFGLIGSAAFAMTLVLNRVLRSTKDATLVTWQTVAAMIVGGVLSLGDWRTPSMVDLGGMLLLGIVASSGHLMITRSLKLAPASLLAPLQYTLLLWAFILGFFIFGDVPGTQVLIGSGVIVLAGLFIFHRKKVVEHAEPSEAIATDGH